MDVPFEKSERGIEDKYNCSTTGHVDQECNL